MNRMKYPLHPYQSPSVWSPPIPSKCQWDKKTIINMIESTENRLRQAVIMLNTANSVAMQFLSRFLVLAEPRNWQHYIRVNKYTKCFEVC